VKRRAGAGAASRVVFWPFGLFGNPGGEAGVLDLSQALGASLAEHEAEPASRLHAVAARTKLEMCEVLEAEDVPRWRRDLHRRFARCLARREFAVFVGGNHLVALPVLEAYAERPERACVVSFDAHLDAYDLAAGRERLNHGNFLLHLARPPRLSIVNVGHRDLVLERRRVRDFFDRDYPVEAIDARPLDALVRELARYLRGFDLVHFDIDLDVLDPSAMRAVGTPMPCGLAPRELVRILDGLFSEKTAGVTISEYDGGRDPDGAGRHFVVFLIERLLLRRAEIAARA
jgi:agmatinase